MNCSPIQSNQVSVYIVVKNSIMELCLYSEKYLIKKIKTDLKCFYHETLKIIVSVNERYSSQIENIEKFQHTALLVSINVVILFRNVYLVLIDVGNMKKNIFKVLQKKIYSFQEVKYFLQFH